MEAMVATEEVVVHGTTLMTTPGMPWDQPIRGGCSDPNCITEEFTIPGVGEKEVVGELLGLEALPSNPVLSGFM